MQTFIRLSSTTSVIGLNISITTEGHLCSRDVAHAKQVKEVKRCTYSTIAVTVDGQAWTGDTALATWFNPITLNERVVQVAAGHDHSVLLTESGRIWVSGTNTYGELGLGSGKPFGSPYTFTLVEGLPIVTQVAANSHHTVAISEGGELWVCGHNFFGQLGLGDKVSRSSFTRVDLPESVLAAYPGDVNIVLTTASGELVSGRSHVFDHEASTVFRPNDNSR